MGLERFSEKERIRKTTQREEKGVRKKNWPSLGGRRVGWRGTVC